MPLVPSHQTLGTFGDLMAIDRIPEALQFRLDSLEADAKSYKTDMETAKATSLTLAAVGAVFSASPLAILIGVLGGLAYLNIIREDLGRTGGLYLIPLYRKPLTALVDAASATVSSEDDGPDVDPLAGVTAFLEPDAAHEYELISVSENGLRALLGRIAPEQRLDAYRYILRWTRLRGTLSLPGEAALRAELGGLEPGGERRRLPAASEVSVGPELAQEPKGTVGPQTVLGAIDVPAVPVAPTVLTEPQAPVAPKAPEGPKSSLELLWPGGQLNPRILQLPVVQRAEYLLTLMERDGFNLRGAMNGSVVCICGNQRGGKGTLAGIIAIMQQALVPTSRVRYYTAGGDIYPFKVDRLLCRRSHHGVPNADQLTAYGLLKDLQDLKSCENYERKGEILVIDEAISLFDELDPDSKLSAIRYMLTRFAKSGATALVVLHASNLSSWVGTGNTGGLAKTFNTGNKFVGCKTQTIPGVGLQQLTIATGEYFTADPGDFGQALRGGDVIGKVPDWLLVEKHPGNGAPDPVRTMLRMFPELYQEPPKEAPVTFSIPEVPTAYQGTEQTLQVPQMPMVSPVASPEPQAQPKDPREHAEALMAKVRGLLAESEGQLVARDIQRKLKLDATQARQAMQMYALRNKGAVKYVEDTNHNGTSTPRLWVIN